MKLSIERKLALGFGASLLVLVLVTSAATWNAVRLRGAHSWIQQAYDVFVRLDQLITDLLSMEASTRGFLLTGDERALAPYRSGLGRLDNGLRRLRELLADNPRQLSRVAQLEPLAARAKELMAQRIEQRRARTGEAASHHADLRPSEHAVTEFWSVLREIAGEESRSLHQRLNRAYRAAWLTIVLAVIGGVLAITCVVVAAWQVRRDLARRRDTEAALQESVARVEDLYNRAPCGYHSLDEHGNFAAINDTALSWLGYTREEVIGKMNFADVLAPASVPDFRKRFAEFLRTGSVQDVEYEWRRKDGSTLPVRLNAIAIYDAQGRYVSSRATVFDVTRRKRAEEERDRFFTLSHDLLCVADFDGKVKRINPAWEHVLGFTSEEMMAQPLMSFVHPDDRERTAAEAERLAAGEETVGFENRYRCKDGSYRWLRWSARAVVAEKLIYASAHDVTESRLAEQRIQKLNTDLAARAQQLEAANQELESFSYSVSHDLRAPLRHIDGFASLLTQRSAATLDKEGQRYVSIIQKAAKRMGVLIDDLLAFSRIGRATLRRELVRHEQLVRQVIADGRFDANGRTILWDIKPIPDVRADPSMIRQVWTNLIDNAVKYSSKQPESRIMVGGHEDTTAGEYVFFVSDNGVGFDMAYADKLFGVFQRLHGPTEFEGTGIGLANVRRIVARHGGRTWAEGRVGEGAIFYFSIPINDSTSGSSSTT